MSYILTLIVLLGIGVSGTKLETLQCSNDQLQRCLISVTLERRTIDLTVSTIDLMRHCRSIREGMNCLVWYSLNCVSQSQRPLSKNVIENVRQYLKDTCEDFDQVDENWMNRNCFLNDEMENCKDNYIKRSEYKTVDEYSCGHYYMFKRCAEQTLNEKCKENHKMYLTTYLFDKAELFSWMCSEEDAYFNNKNDQMMLRSIKGAQCLINQREKLSECRRSYDQRDNFIESDDIFASACCAFNMYSSCTEDVIGKNCGIESRELTDAALSRLNRDLSDECRNYNYDTCSSCSALSSLIILVIAMLAVLEGWKNM